jgi:nucleotide-binding universal stress UspA family protein
MAIAFNTILIPVDFSVNTEIAVKKAMELAGGEPTEVHLLHVARPGKRPERQFALWASYNQLGVWRNKIKAKHPAVQLKTHVLQGHSVQQMIVECARLLRPDLIVIGKSNPPSHWGVTDRHWWQSVLGRWPFFGSVPPDVIARRTNCPVLTVKPGSAGSRTRVILIPIGDFLPERKLEWAVLLAKKYRAQVHLLAIHHRQETRDWALPQVFLKAYHQLREHLHHPIEYSATSRQSPAKAALNCAESIMADMIVVNPATESGVPGLAGYRHISDLLGRDSKIQVLDIEP